MLTTVAFRFRKRQIPLNIDSPPRYDLPEEWQECEYEFSFESRAGIQEIPGAFDATDADRRHVVIVAPREFIDTSDKASWPSFSILGTSHTIGGTIVLTPATTAGAHVFNGGGDDIMRAYYVEAEEMSKMGKWRGGWRSLFWRW